MPKTSSSIVPNEHRTPPAQTPLWAAAKRRHARRARQAQYMWSPYSSLTEKQYEQLKHICHRSPVKFVSAESRDGDKPLARVLFPE